MKTATPQQVYRQKQEQHKTHLAKLAKKRSRLGWLRLSVFLLTILTAYQIFTSYGLIGLVPTVFGIAVLLYLVSIDVQNNNAIRNTKTLIRINEEELQVLDHRFAHREDGHSFIPDDHAYAGDLDIFGKASFYQLLNRCFTEQGRQRMAAQLLSQLPMQQVIDRQQAIKELASQLEWRQRWQAFAMQTTITATTERKIRTWLSEEKEHFAGTFWRYFLPVYSTLTIGSAAAAIFGYIPGTAFSSLFLLYLIISLLMSRQAILPYIHLTGIVKETATLQALIKWLESLSMQAAPVKNLQVDIRNGNTSAASEIAGLKVILDRFDLRNNIFGLLVFNSFLLWDVRQMRALNAWRRRNRNHVAGWFNAIAEMEVLHSISTLHFNYPEWCFPEITNQHFTLSGTAIGHPLLAVDQRVSNDFDMAGVAQIGLITGSNMAGKSTFLRSLGVNCVLALMGAPVCAAAFRLSPLQLVSSMRIADNLAENTSTFYAELKKLRTIIERVKAHEKVFILLDEILRGTNSYDRHTGAAALLKQLIKEDAVAVIATHDVELAQLETNYPSAVKNYHFDVQVEGEELYFDYKLKTGVCQSLNASILMKKIGIELS
jgi:hypothetical protein